MIQYKWIIKKLITASNEAGLENVVKAIYWEREATDGVNTEVVEGAKCLTTIDENNFINYNNLKYDNVCSWLSDLKDEIDANLEKKLTSKIENIIIQELPLPF